ncbi:unnamed protein product [Soboliphyme baturini]|uniref:Anoctamin n=1 Tax=Soboliphyme baturini TaxID=241478 RepID=A0A183IT98_9BILA|nr:unnamed protein product [Soboliphyme baturini]
MLEIISMAVAFQATHLFDNLVTVLFAIFMSTWAALFLEGWKRRQNELAWKWDLLDFELEEDVIRPEFLRTAKKLAVNPITKETEPYLPFPERFFRMFTSGVTVLFFLCLFIAFAIGIIIYRVVMIHHFDKHESSIVRVYAGLAATAVSALLNLIIIMLLERVYTKLAWCLTNWEYPRTQSEFDNSFTCKVFMFQFINYYSSLFYIAFFKGRFVTLPGSTNATMFGYKPEMCDMRGCMVELLIQLSMIMIGKQFINNFFEIGIPVITKKFRQMRQAWKYSCRLPWEFDYYLNPVPPTYLIDEYLEVVLQFGFVTLFVAAFPLAPFFALLNNIVEIRIDAYKYIVTYRRPTPVRVKDLGIWNNILESLSNLAVLTNVILSLMFYC